MKNRIGQMGQSPNRNRKRHAGFSLIELMLVVAIVMIVAGMALPKIITSIHDARLHGAGADFSGLLQKARLQSVQDDSYYTTYFATVGSLQEAYVDLLHNNGTGADPGDPLIQINSEISIISASNAPSTSNLKGQFLPTGSTLTVNDAGSSSTPIIFSPRGLPCTSMSVPGGTICNSAGGATAYWVFLQNSVTQVWEAITLSPAGRIEKWRYDGVSSWIKM